MTIGFKGPSWYWDTSAWVFSVDKKWTPYRVTILGIEFCWGYGKPLNPKGFSFKF